MIMCTQRTSPSVKREVPYNWGPAGSGVLDAVSCYLSVSLKHSDTELDTKKIIVDQNQQRCVHLRPSAGKC